MTCVYLHKKSDTGEVFYVGKGSIRRSRTSSERSEFWMKTAKKHGFDVVIIDRDLSDDDAFALEVLLIKLFGRRNLGTGTLVNLTDGGEGSSGYRHTDEAKRKISEASKSISPESRYEGGRKRIGYPQSEFTRRKRSHSMIGNTNSVVAGPRNGSKYKGVNYFAKNRKWVAKITIEGVQKYLGSFSSDCDAAIAYDKAAYEAWGDICYLNIPQERR